MMIKKYRKKPVMIEAIQLTYDTHVQKDIAKWCGGKIGPDGSVFIETLEGQMTAVSGDYIIKGIQNEFYPCKPDIFEQTYEEVQGDG